MKSEDCSFQFHSDDDLHIRLSLLGQWCREHHRPEAQEALSGLGRFSNARTIVLDGQGLESWDSTFLVFLSRFITGCREKDLEIDGMGLPHGVRRLLDLASAVPAKKDARKQPEKVSFLSHVGEETLSFVRSAHELLGFLGETTIAMGRFFRRRARYRQADFVVTLQECGINALPIVSLISLLVGLILAFVGAIQLKMFGAELYVADLVGIAMVRVMGAVMVGIIMAGRTGAAFAAQIGTMEVNEEIDALRTLGVNPVEFLVLPRVVGLAVMMPLLCLYANFMGILGGLIVGVGLLHLNLLAYVLETCNAVRLSDLWVGLFQGTLFGILVALTGCLRGMKCGRSAAAVGDAATSAVVTGIVSIVVTTALVTVICNLLGI